MSDPEQVENEYRTALGSSLAGARSQAWLVERAFDRVQTALEGGAWVSSVADTFAQECATKESSAATAADDVVAALQARYDSEPAKVASTDRRAHWY